VSPNRNTTRIFPNWVQEKNTNEHATSPPRFCYFLRHLLIEFTSRSASGSEGLKVGKPFTPSMRQNGGRDAVLQQIEYRWSRGVIG